MEQGLLEFGIFSISFPGNKIPNHLHLNFLPVTTDWWYQVVQYNLPKRRNCKITGLNICVIYHAHGEPCSYANKGELFIDITNVSKDVKWVYCPTFIGIPDDGEDMTWLCHWEMKNQLEGGDELRILVHLRAGTQLKKFGIQVVYEQQVKGKAKGIHPCQNACVGDLSAYQLVTDFYVLCHGHYWPARMEGLPLFCLPWKSNISFTGLAGV